MQDALLFAAAAAIFAVGYLIMKKTDLFLDKVCQTDTSPEAPAVSPLHLGFSAPLTAEDISGILDGFFTEYPGISLSLVRESEQKAAEELSSGHLDLIFLSEEAALPSSPLLHHRQILLRNIPEATDTELPSARRQIRSNVFWVQTAAAPAALCFLRTLEKRDTPAEIGKKEPLML